MTLADDLRIRSEEPIRSLADRKPGHAVMTKVLADLGPEAIDHVAAQVATVNRSWYDGAIGELIVGHELARLPELWRVLHSVPVGSNGRDLDHLVIGPGGVFLLNTKRHVGARVSAGTHVTWVREGKEHYQGNIKRAATEVGVTLADELPAGVQVRPVLVFVQSGEFRQVGEQQVAALQSHHLIDYLRSQPAILTEEQVQRLARLAGVPETWGLPPDVVREPDPTVRFLSLRPPGPGPIQSWTPLRSTPIPSIRQPGPRVRTASGRHTPRRPARSPRSSSRRAVHALFRVLGALLMIPVSIGALQIALQVWLTLLKTH